MPTPSIPPKSRLQIAGEYQISESTLRRRLLGLAIILPSGAVLPAFQRLIYEGLGYPAGVASEDYADIPLPDVDREANRPPFKSVRLRPLRNNAMRS